MELRSGTVVAPSPQKQTQTQIQSQSQPETRPLLSAEGLGMFHRGVGLLLSRWTALQLAIQNSWGGSSSHIKAQQLHDDVVSWMAQPKGNASFFSLCTTSCYIMPFSRACEWVFQRFWLIHDVAGWLSLKVFFSPPFMSPALWWTLSMFDASIPYFTWWCSCSLSILYFFARSVVYHAHSNCRCKRWELL